MSDIVEVAPTGQAERIEGSNELQLPRIGDWYWLRQSYKQRDDYLIENDRLEDKKRRKLKKAELGTAEASFSKTYDDYYERFVTVTDIGSNYIKVSAPKVKSASGSSYLGESWRIHLDEMDGLLRRELDPKTVIGMHLNQHRVQVAHLLGEVQRITQQLGVGQQSLGEGGSAQAAETSALVHAAGIRPVEEFKAALTLAKEKTLPELFKAVEIENALMASWMNAELLPLRAQAEKGLKPIIERIDNRIFNVELYAGLVEEVVQIREGEHAEVGEPIHLMQRRHYMDEECLINYEAGGMNFQKVEDFDRWLAKPENARRIFPFKRCLVAFRIRRHEKEYLFEGGSFEDFLSFTRWVGDAKEADMATFLYIRNGAALYRLTTSHDFGEQLFPDEKLRHLTGALYAKNEHFGKWQVITEGDYEERKAAYAAAVKELPAKQREYEKALKAFHEKWAMYLDEVDDDEDGDRSRTWNVAAYEKRLDALKAKGETFLSVVSGKEMTAADGWARDRDYEAAHRQGYYEERPRAPSRPHDESSGFEPFNDSSVYYDDIQAFLQKQRDQHNRLVLVLQGLLDRSPVLHPHPKWQLWTDVGFQSALVLHYDSARALPASEEGPLFRSFQKAKNANIKAGSLVTGVYYWWRKEQEEKASKRYDPYGRHQRSHFPDGPDKVMRVTSLRKGRVYFEWTKVKEFSGHYNVYRRWVVPPPRVVKVRFSCTVDQVLCVDDYKAGEYLQFFEDPRTRAEYIRWAPYLLAAEDFVHGKAKVREPVKDNVEEDESEES